jgi:hypothetical protein
MRNPFENRQAGTENPGIRREMISAEDIRRRAFEIYRENKDPSHTFRNDWFTAERELKGSDGYDNLIIT